MDIKPIVIAAALGAVWGFGGSYFFIKEQSMGIQERLNQSPPIVIVDFAKVASSYPAGASQEELEQMMVRTNNAIVQLKEAGYLILDASSVVGAPSDVYLTEEVLR